MNDMSLPALSPRVPQVQEFFTAAELAEMAKRFGYKAFPHTESGAVRYAKRAGWNEMPPSRCRKRAGKEGGGGYEYHISMETRLMGLLAAERIRQADRETSRAVTVRKSDDEPGTVKEQHRRVAEARGQVLTAITSYASRWGMKHSRAITDFIEAQKGHEAWLAACHKRDAGEFLTLSDKLKLKEGSPMVALPPADEPKKRRTADHRFPFGFGVAEELLAAANNRPRKGSAFQKVSRTTLYDWFKAYDERGLGALAPATTKHEEPIPGDFWRFMAGYAKPAKPKIAEVHRTYLAGTPAGAVPLSINQIEYILRTKLDHIQKNKGREGRLALRARLAFHSRETSEILPGTIYVGDGHTFDARVEDPGGSRAPMRPEITTIMDVTTRRAVGWAISRKENVIAVTEAMRNACTDYCIPAVVYFDRGAGYKNKTFDNEGNGLMARLDITKTHALPYGSQAKGNIERLHQTIWIPFARELPTYLGEDMDKEARLKADKQIKTDRREFGYSKLLMPWQEFRQECQHRIDEYNNRPHSELPRFTDPVTGRIRFMSPNEYWQSHVDQGFEPVLVDPFMMDDLFRPYEKRTVHRCLIELWTNEYFSYDLNPYHQQEVYVGYDYNQADRVWVREIDPETREVGKLICVAAYGGNKVSYMPKTFLEVAVERREKGRLKRNDQNREGILEERNAPLILDHQPIGPVIDLSPQHELEPVPLRPAPAPVTRLRSSHIDPDAELALQCLADPSQLTPGRARLLRDVMSSRAGQEVLRNSGVDLITLDDLLRSAA